MAAKAPLNRSVSLPRVPLGAATTSQPISNSSIGASRIPECLVASSSPAANPASSSRTSEGFFT